MSFSIKYLKVELNHWTFIGFFGCLISFFLIYLNSIFLKKPHSKKFSMIKTTKNKYKKVNNDETNDNPNLSYSSNNIFINKYNLSEKNYQIIYI